MKLGTISLLHLDRRLITGVLLTGKVPFSCICLSEVTISAIERASAQSQSSSPFFVGSLYKVRHWKKKRTCEIC